MKTGSQGPNPSCCGQSRPSGVLLSHPGAFRCKLMGAGSGQSWGQLHPLWRFGGGVQGVRLGCVELDGTPSGNTRDQRVLHASGSLVTNFVCSVMWQEELE